MMLQMWGSMPKLLVGLLLLSLLLAGCAQPAPTPTRTPVPTPTPVLPIVSVKLEASAGAPPAAGWKWAVAEFNTTAQEVTDGPHDHDFAWVFFTTKGSAEVTMGDAKKVISAGEGVLIPARQRHSHRYLPQSKLIAFHLRAADQPIAALHRGTTILVSDKALEMRPGADYKVRIREFTFLPGSRSSESLTSDPNFGYLAEGTLTFTVGQTANTVEAGKPFVFPLNEKYVVSNQGTTPLRFILMDVRP